jgi:hypothetical protein
VLTAIGPIRVERWHGRCEGCGQVGFAADELLGLDGGLTTRARRMACLAGVNEPFRKAEQLLTELAGWSLDAETLRRKLVNLRLKRTGARWQAARVGRFVELLALSDSPEWEEHWSTLAA